MWQRFKRVIRSIVGSIIGSAEDPERILEQNIRDMEDQVPRINAQIAMVRANLTLMQKEADRYEKELADLVSKIKAALSAGRDDIAEEFAVQLEATRAHAARSKAQVESAERAYEKALEVKNAFMREKERKTRDAMDAMRQARQSRWQAKVAQAMETFDVAGIDATHDEMVRRVEEKAALDSAQLDMAIGSVDITRAKIEEEAEKTRAQEILAQFKQEMGIEDAAAPAKTKAAQAAGSGKTIAKTRKKTRS